MATTVVVDVNDKLSSPLHSPSRQNCLTYTCRRRRNMRDDFGKYEVGVLLITQLSYIPIASTMLSTSMYKPSQRFCDEFNGFNSTREVDKILKGEFFSLLMEWNEGCSGSLVLTVLSTSIMFGALFGAFLAGWLADVYGRKPVVQGSLLLVFLGNIIFAFVAPFSWLLAASLLFALGMACGGYMVTNLVFLVECFENPRSRLLGVSLNGWSISMVAVAVIAYFTNNWFLYHITVAATSLLAAFACHFLTFESCRWLAGVHRLTDAKAVATKIALWNGHEVHSEATWSELLGFNISSGSYASSGKVTEHRRYGYADLFSFPSVYRPLISLCYCFVASSIVSFGFYFVVDMLPGDRYGTMALMGALKFSLGLLPFLVSKWMGRKPIVTISLSAACIAVWVLCISQLLGASPHSLSVTALSLIVAASLDPTWKISHLYSAELFPTVVRNMARGFCNVGARLGSVAAPMVVHLRSEYYLLPFIVFAVLLSVQLIVVITCLPETKNRPLPDHLPEEYAANEKLQLDSLDNSVDCPLT